MRTLMLSLKSDEALMLAYQRGQVAAFDTLYQRYRRPLFAFVYRQLPEVAVEEVVQETWMAVVDSAARYQASAAFKSYLFQIARHKIADSYRRQAPARAVDDWEALAATESGLQSPDQHGDRCDSDRLLAAVRALPAEQRDAFLLREEGFSLQEIAAISGCAAETAKSRLRYATRSLRQQFEVKV